MVSQDASKHLPFLHHAYPLEPLPQLLRVKLPHIPVQKHRPVAQLLERKPEIVEMLDYVQEYEGGVKVCIAGADGAPFHSETTEAAIVEQFPLHAVHQSVETSSHPRMQSPVELHFVFAEKQAVVADPGIFGLFACGFGRQEPGCLEVVVSVQQDVDVSCRAVFRVRVVARDSVPFQDDRSEPLTFQQVDHLEEQGVQHGIGPFDIQNLLDERLQLFQ